MYLTTLFALFGRCGQITVDTLCLHNNTSNYMPWEQSGFPQYPQSPTAANRVVSVETSQAAQLNEPPRQCGSASGGIPAC